MGELTNAAAERALFERSPELWGVALFVKYGTAKRYAAAREEIRKALTEEERQQVRSVL